MRAVIQRVNDANVVVEGNEIAKINKGILVLLGVNSEDTEDNIPYLVEKIANLRIFSDENDKMNLSLLDIEGEILVVSQFTLYGDCRRGRRPSYSNAARPEKANDLYEKFISKMKTIVKRVEHGQFGADMKVSLTNDGPVTLIIDSI